jgi:hypothetical protein
MDTEHLLLGPNGKNCKGASHSFSVDDELEMAVREQEIHELRRRMSKDMEGC